MKRGAPMKRTGFKSRIRKEPTAPREPHPVAETGIPVTVKSLHRGSYGPAAITAVAKPSTPRNPAVLEMARGRLCLFQVPGICTEDRATTVACHENEGKGMGLKNSDARCVFGCAACHRWFDQGTAPRDVKRAYFGLAYLRQLDEHRRIASDMGEPIRFRKAAQWALDQQGANHV